MKLLHPYKLNIYIFSKNVYYMNYNKVNNGRIDIKSPDTKKLFNMYDKIPTNECVTFRNPLKGIWDNTILSNTFFSKENIQILQNGIRSGVYTKSNKKYVIGEQDCDTLKIVMRSVFLQYSVNSGSNLTGQIEDLNKLVLKYCIHQVYGEAQGYVKYLSDASTMATPLSHPIMTSSKDKQLEMKSWF